MNNPEISNKDSHNIRELKDFINTCRQEGISDQQAEKMAVSLNKWDKNLINSFVNSDVISDSDLHSNQDDLTVEKSKNNRAQLPALLMVIHHISLWFYIISIVTVTIALISMLSFNNRYGSSSSFVTAIVSLVIVLFVTGGIYYTSLYFYYKKLKKNPELQTGRIFSLINIAYSLITIIGSIATVLIVVARYIIEKNYNSNDVEFNNILTNGVSSDYMQEKVSFDTEIFFISISLIIIYTGIFLTYYATDFIKPYSIRQEDGTEKVNPKRIIIIVSSIIATLTLILIIIITSIASVGSYSKDEETIARVTHAIETINQKVKETDTLPDSNEIGNVINNSEITYNITGNYTYDICANFKNDTQSDYYYYNEPENIASNRLYDLDSHSKGNHCYSIIIAEEYRMEKDNNYLDLLQSQENTNGELTAQILNF